MNKFIKLSLIVYSFWFLVFGLGSLAQQEPPPYPTGFWIMGSLDAGTTGLSDLSGFTVIFYKHLGNPWDAYAIATSDASGRFLINAHDDLRLLPLTAETYYVRVGSKEVSEKFYGKNETPVTFEVTDLQNGFKDIGTLALEEFPGQPTTVEVLSDTGWIRDTTITRDGNDIVLNWDYDPARGATAVKIYVASGPPTTEFVADVERFSNLGSVTSETKTYRHSDIARNDNNYYYRIVPDPLPTGTTILSAECNSITVGKVVVTVPANKYVFTALPFQEDVVSLAGIVADQLGEGGEFLWWDGMSYYGATYSGGRWTGEDRNLRIGEGFVVRAREKTNLAMVGRFGTPTMSYTRTLPAKQYNLIVYPYPTSKDLSAMGVVPTNGDDLLRWVVDGQAYEGATYSGETWVGPAGIDNLELARPRYYRSGEEKSWTIIF